jgi:LPS sulfotransferase NodH
LDIHFSRVNNFVIITKPRSGSTHLAQFLDCVKDITVANTKRNYHYEPLNGNPNYSIEDFYKSKGKVKGMKISIKHLQDRHIEYINHNSIKIILLNRESLKEQFISHIYAYVSKKWHTNKNNFQRKQIEVTESHFKEMVKRFTMLTKKYEQVKEILNNNLVMETMYENIITDAGKKEVLEFLDITWKDEYSNFNIEKKLLNDNYEKFFINYKEVSDRVEEVIATLEK